VVERKIFQLIPRAAMRDCLSRPEVRITVVIPADRRDELLAFVATLQATS
jgi:hypothetical protein